MSSTKRNILLGILCLLAASVHAQTTVQLPPWTHQQFLDSAGRPLAAGCVNTYAAGTTTPLVTYTDSSGSVVNSNPIILDSGGFANIWLQAGVAYKFVITSNGGVNCASGTLQWTVDGITTSSASGGSSATSVTSATTNPASAGVIRLAKSDTVCWRNASNAANLCLSLDSSNNLTWGGISLFLTEGACPSGVSGEDGICADSTAHRFKMTNNAGSVDSIVGQASTDTLTNKTFDTGGTGNVFKIAGTQITAVTGSGSAVLATSPTLATPIFNSPAVHGAVNDGGFIINTGINNNGTGLQHVRITGCHFLSAPSSCSGSGNWNTTWADTSYTMACTMVGSAIAYVHVGVKSTTTFGFDLFNDSGAAETPEIDCIGIHD